VLRAHSLMLLPSRDDRAYHDCPKFLLAAKGPLPMERKLAAILATDVVGYSRLMAENEADTFDRLRAHRRELFEPEIAEHHGRIFKLVGDGLLAEFGSVVDAVECAAVLQREMARRNDGLPDDRPSTSVSEYTSAT
jgi:class 3 adenylate cyclase